MLSVGYSLHFVDMRTSVAAGVRSALAKMPPQTFVHATALPGSLSAVEVELARLARRGEIRRLRRGLYWRGPKTLLGIAAPDPEAVALEVAGPGAGPAGVAAAHWLGLTTQIPGRPSVAVPGRVPAAIPGVRFCSRTTRRRELGMRPLEVAVVEVLREWPMFVESDWNTVCCTIGSLVESSSVRPAVIAADVIAERHTKLREHWAAMQTTFAAAL